MSNEQEVSPLAEFDLSTWDAPAPPPGLADAVIARVTQPVGAAAIEPSERPRRWWIATALGAVVASAAVVAVILARGAHRAGDDHGEVVATRPQHLDLDTVTADLDAGATVTWKRDRDGLVAQQRGTVTWRVADDDKLRIDSGATLAPIAASGASLRVEAHMNLSDARTLGIVSLTAATVAFVTVIVYEGHIRVGTGGQTVNVEPGTTVEVRPGKPPAPPAPPELVGANADHLRQLEDEIKLLQEDNDRLQHGDRNVHINVHHDVAAGTAFAGGADRGVCNEVTCVIDSYTGPCCAKFVRDHALAPSAAPAELDRSAISMAVGNVKDRVMACGDKTAMSGIVKLHVLVGPDGQVTNAEVQRTPDEALGICSADVMKTAMFPRTQHGGSFNYPFTFSGATSVTADCDAADLADKGKQNINVGAFAAALASFEASLSCKRDMNVIKLAFMAACRGSNVAKARTYYALLPVSSQSTLIAMCTNNQIDPRSDQALSDGAGCNPFDSMKGCAGGAHAAPACDAADLADQGKSNLSVSAFAAALSNFEASLRCKPDPNVVKLAYMAACRGSNAAKAKQYYLRLPAAAQTSMIMMCLSNRIDPTPTKPAAPGYLQVLSKPDAATIAVDGVDTGLTTPIKGHELPLPPGKHTVTFGYGDDHFTFPVEIKAGETETITKDPKGYTVP